MQPGSIKKFEAFYLVAWGISLIITFLGWNSEAILDSNIGRRLGFGLYSGTIALGLLIPPLLCYFAARKRSNVARWIIVGIFVVHALAMLSMLFTVSFGSGVLGALSIIVFVLRAIAVRFLFGAEAREWFARRRTAVDVPATGPVD